MCLAKIKNKIMCLAQYQHSINDNLLLCWLLIYFDLKELRSPWWRLKFTQGTPKRTHHSAKFKLEGVVDSERKDQKSSPHGEAGWDLSCEPKQDFLKL